MENKRYLWVDNVKIFAIVLIVLGHLLQSFLKSGIISSSIFTDIANGFIYTFHVQLFFLCSGFLYQSLTKKQNASDYGKNVIKKLVDFSIPYFVFTLISYLLKTVFSSSVNQENTGGLLHTLFVSPMSPYWFLYILFLLFLISPIIHSKTDGTIRLVVGAVLCITISIINIENCPDIIKTLSNLLTYYVWFIFGMAISYFNITDKFKSILSIFLPISFILYCGVYFIQRENNITLNGVGFIISALAIIGTLAIFMNIKSNKKENKFTTNMANYVMPIFLMHTIFAAGIRAVLMKVGISNSLVHIVVGTIFAFLGPIIAAFIMSKIKLDILYRPSKYIKLFRTKNS